MRDILKSKEYTSYVRETYLRNTECHHRPTEFIKNIVCSHYQVGLGAVKELSRLIDICQCTSRIFKKLMYDLMYE